MFVLKYSSPAVSYQVTGSRIGTCLLNIKHLNVKYLIYLFCSRNQKPLKTGLSLHILDAVWFMEVLLVVHCFISFFPQHAFSKLNQTLSQCLSMTVTQNEGSTFCTQGSVIKRWIYDIIHNSLREKILGNR